MNNSIHYKKRRRYKYTLHEDYHLEAFIYPDKFISTRFIELGEHGWLAIRKGYAWDGPSDPAPDFKMLMRGSLVHDALYQLMREHYLSLEKRKEADLLMRKIFIEDGVPVLLAYFFYSMVRIFGETHAKPDLQQAP